MRFLGLLFLGVFAYTSYYYWLKFPHILDKIFKLKDQRLDRTLTKIWKLNVNARAFAIHKLMKSKRNQDYIRKGSPELLTNYLRAKKYWYWSLAPLVVLIAITQIEQAYEMLFHREEFQAKIDNSWFAQTFERIFGNDE